MKRFVLFLFGMFFYTVCFADTETINWYVDGNSYATTTCQTGGDIILPTAPTKYGYTFQGWIGYTPIEYIESTGTQYIDTGVIPNSATTVQTKIYIPKYYTSNWNVFFGSNMSYNSGAEGFGANVRGNEKKFYADYLGVHQTTLSSELYRWYDIELVSNNQVYSLSVDNEIIYSEAHSRYPETTKTIYLFGQNTNYGYRWPSSIRMKHFKIWKDSVLVRDFIPVLDNNDVPCMYDKVTEECFYNAGTNSFTTGPVISGGGE